MRQGGRELRQAKRKGCRNAAWIGLSNGRTRIPCVLWDLSDTGARIAAPRSKALPPVFNLVLAKNGSSPRACRVVWRNDRQLGVQFIQATADEMEELSARRQPASPSDASVSSSSAAAAFLLPGYGPHFVEKPARRGLRISSFAAAMLFMLAASTALFLMAGMHSALEAPWALQVCDSVGNFCRHPEWTGMAGGLMTVIYLAVRGMEN
jgi:hypothetical protein